MIERFNGRIGRDVLVTTVGTHGSNVCCRVTTPSGSTC